MTSKPTTGKRDIPPASRAISLILLVLLMFLAACSGAPATRTGPATGKNRPVATMLPTGKPGWPVKPQAYLGRYRMTWSSDRAFAQAGLLTLFMRQVMKPKKMIVPSGVLSAFGRDETTVLYITKLGRNGTRGSAEASAGNYAYAPVGLIELTRFDQLHHTLGIKLHSSAGRPIELRFARYSA